MKTSSRDENKFRRLAVVAGISIWAGLILLAVGLVFSVGNRRGAQAAMAIVTVTPDTVAAMTTAPIETATPETIVMEKAALEPAATMTPQATNAAVPTSTATATATAIPIETPTQTPIPSPTVAPPPRNTSVPEPTPTEVSLEGAPTRLVIPVIGVDTKVIPVGWQIQVVEGARLAIWDVADFAASWHKTSGKPGQPNNIVISGHHNIKGEVFRDLSSLEPGAEVIVYVGDAPFYYQVVNKLILPEKGMPLEVRKENAKYIMPTTEEQLTLVTCWPYNNNTHRVIVIAKPKPQ